MDDQFKKGDSVVNESGLVGKIYETQVSIGGTTRYGVDFGKRETSTKLNTGIKQKVIFDWFTAEEIVAMKATHEKTTAKKAKEAKPTLVTPPGSGTTNETTTTTTETPPTVETPVAETAPKTKASGK